MTSTTWWRCSRRAATPGPSCPRAPARATGGAVAPRAGIVLNVEALDPSRRSTCSRARSSAPASSTRPQGRGRRGRPLLPARPRVVGDLHDRRQRRDERGRAVLREVRRDRRLRARLQVVLPGGEVIRTGHRTAKGVAGSTSPASSWARRAPSVSSRRPSCGSLRRPTPRSTALAIFDTLSRPAPASSHCGSSRPALPARAHGPPASDAVHALADFGFPDDCAGMLLVQSDRPGGTTPTTCRGMRTSSPTQAPRTSQWPRTRGSRSCSQVGA